MGAQLSSVTRDLTCILVRVLDSDLAYRAFLRATLSKYLRDAEITEPEAFEWTAEKFVKDLLDETNSLNKLLMKEIENNSQLLYLVNDQRFPLSSHLQRSALLVMDELRLDLSLHKKLFECCANNDMVTINKLSQFIDYDVTDDNGCSALMIAAHHGHSELVVRVLELAPHSDVDKRDQYGWTALMYASRQGHTALVRLLVSVGASVNAMNRSQCSALMCACVSGHSDIVQLLIDSGASLNTRSRSGDTALIQAVRHGHYQCVRLLVNHGANIDGVGHRNRSPALVAASDGRYEILEYLISEGAVIDTVDDDGTTVCSFETHPTPTPIITQSSTSSNTVKKVQSAGLIAAAIQRGIIARFNKLIARPVRDRRGGSQRRFSDAITEENDENIHDGDDSRQLQQSPLTVSVDGEVDDESERKNSNVREVIDSTDEDEVADSPNVDTSINTTDTNTTSALSPNLQSGRVVAGEDTEESDSDSDDSNGLSSDDENAMPTTKLTTSLSFSHPRRATSANFLHQRPKTPPAPQSQSLIRAVNRASYDLLAVPSTVLVHRVPSPGSSRVSMEVRQPKRRVPQSIDRPAVRARILALRQAAFVPDSKAAKQLREVTQSQSSPSTSSDEDDEEEQEHRMRSQPSRRTRSTTEKSPPSSSSSSTASSPSHSAQHRRPIFPRTPQHSVRPVSSQASDEEIEQETNATHPTNAAAAVHLAANTNTNTVNATTSAVAQQPEPIPLPSAPPIILLHANWRAHLDSTPVASWLLHYQFDGRVFDECENLSFRAIYAWTEAECVARFGRKQGRRLFAATRSYARAVQRAYSERDQEHKERRNEPATALPLIANGAKRKHEAKIVEPVKPVHPVPTHTNTNHCNSSSGNGGRPPHHRSDSRSEAFVSLLSGLGSLTSNVNHQFALAD